MSVSGLTQEEFAFALERGRGRAVQYVQRFGLTEVAKTVLAACLHNQAYDPQCESGRAPWLYGLFKGSPEYAWFSAQICRALAEETDDYDLEQLCELAALMGKDGDQAAVAVLRARVLGQPFTAKADFFGCPSLVMLDGIEAAVELARRFGGLLSESDDIWQASLSYLVEDESILPALEQRLQALAEGDSAIRAFWEKNQPCPSTTDADEFSPEQRQQARRERFRAENSLEKVLTNAAAQVGSIPAQYMLFGRNATDAELRTVLERLVDETDEGVCLRLLWVFLRTPMPTLPPRLWVLAESSDPQVRRAAVAALSQSSEPRVGAYGRARLQAADFSASESGLLDIFIKHYRSGDEELMISALCRISPDDEDAHDFCFGIRKICEAHSSTALREVLEWAYEHNPCSLCRHHLLSLMLEAQCASAAIIAECRYDANEDTRALAQDCGAVEYSK